MYTIKIAHDSKFVVSGKDDKTIRVWNFEEKRQETVLKGHKLYVKAWRLFMKTNTSFLGHWIKH